MKANFDWLQFLSWQCSGDITQQLSKAPAFYISKSNLSSIESPVLYTCAFSCTDTDGKARIGYAQERQNTVNEKGNVMFMPFSRPTLIE